MSGLLDESRISEVPDVGVRSFATIQDVQSSHVKFKPRSTNSLQQRLKRPREKFN